MSDPTTSALLIRDGVALVMFAQEFGYSVDLQAAQRLIESTRPGLATGARNPAGAEIVPRPLVIEQPAPPIDVADHSLEGPVRITLYAFGAVTGVLGGVLIAANIDSVMSAIEALFGFQVLPKGIYFIDQLPSDLRTADVIQIGLSALGLSLLATLYPSWRASKLDPAQALRYE